MELNFELTPRIKILLGILGCLLLAMLGLQVVPAFYDLFTNRDIEARQEELLKSENLVYAAGIFKAVEYEIYKATGLAPPASRMAPRVQNAVTLFDRGSPETVVRAHIDALVRRAGIQQNYQLLTKPGTAKQTQKLTMQTRENLVRYLYFKHLEAEEQELIAIVEPQEGIGAFKNLMDAWLSGSENDKEPEPVTQKQEPKHNTRPTDPIAAAAAWKFAPLPETIPISIRIKLAAFIKAMTLQDLRGATDFTHGFFDTQVHKTTVPAVSGIFGIGAKPATVEVQLRADSKLLDFLNEALDTVETEEPLDPDKVQRALVEYVKKIQEQQAELVDRLASAPPTYQTEMYVAEMKFKTDLEKLVKLNYLLETNAKWLTVRDLRISPDKQAESRSMAARGRNPGSDRASELNVDIFLVARIF